VSEKGGLRFVSSGCTLLDCVLGGGYVLGRITNIVGDKSTAKTALATEALINFKLQYPEGHAAYRESEAAFDQGYAKAMGLPIKQIDFGDPNDPLQTVEGFARDFNAFLDDQLKRGTPGIYVLDSLDALSDEEEIDADLSKNTYGARKAKALSIFFRTTARRIEKSQVILLVISQVRDNIGVRFGEKHKRSGGRALDFYASQVLWLSHLRTNKKSIEKVERPYGIMVKAKAKKNKVALPFRECEFPFIFGYGVEDLTANVTWLHEIGRLPDADIAANEYKEYLRAIDKMTHEEYIVEQKAIAKVVKRVWAQIETTFLPRRAKYKQVDE